MSFFDGGRRTRELELEYTQVLSVLSSSGPERAGRSVKAISRAQVYCSHLEAQGEAPDVIARNLVIDLSKENNVDIGHNLGILLVAQKYRAAALKGRDARALRHAITETIDRTINQFGTQTAKRDEPLEREFKRSHDTIRILTEAIEKSGVLGQNPNAQNSPRFQAYIYGWLEKATILAGFEDDDPRRLAAILVIFNSILVNAMELYDNSAERIIREAIAMSQNPNDLFLEYYWRGRREVSAFIESGRRPLGLLDAML